MHVRQAAKLLTTEATQHYCCVMIPEFVTIHSVWKVLPPGIHDATIEEIERRFANNEVRRKLFDGFKRGVEALRLAGCKVVFLDGSYVTERENPGDFDACWEPTGVDHRKLDPVLLDFSSRRQRQKQKYAGEFFPSSALADGIRTFVEYFQIDKYTGKARGLIRVRLP